MLRPHFWFCILGVAFWPAICNSAAQAQTSTNQTSEARASGIKLYEVSKYDQAVSVLKTAVKNDKADYQAWYFLGLAQIKLDDYKAAGKSLQNVVKLQPDFALGHNALAYTSLMRNRLTDAIRAAESALRLNPQIKEAHYIIGVANLRGDNADAALRRADAIIELDPKFAVAYLLRSQALVGFSGSVLTSPRDETAEDRRARYGKAKDALEKYLELVPNADHRKVWLDQLASLRFHIALHDKGTGPDRVFSGKEVTTKARVLAKPAPEYTPEARRYGITGTVVLRCIFAADGKPKHFLVVSGLPFGLSESAIAAARKIKFTPAMVDGQPVSMYVQLEYNFNLY